MEWSSRPGRRENSGLLNTDSGSKTARKKRSSRPDRRNNDGLGTLIVSSEKRW